MPQLAREATRSSETSLYNKPTRGHIPEGGRESFKSFAATSPPHMRSSGRLSVWAITGRFLRNRPRPLQYRSQRGVWWLCSDVKSSSVYTVQTARSVRGEHELMHVALRNASVTKSGILTYIRTRDLPNRKATPLHKHGRHLSNI
jgi:hypothetical protein